jgi:citrate synthase
LGNPDPRDPHFRRSGIALSAAADPPGSAFQLDGEFLTAKQAAALLGVKLATVYAYTSRGLIRSVPGSKGRSRRYRRSDLERLCARRDARAGHGPVAAAALRQGEPVLDSSITLISLDDGPIYRGQSAVALAREGRSFESVAEGLWSGDWAVKTDPGSWRPEGLGFDLEALQRVVEVRAGPLAVLSLGISLLAARDPGRFSWHREAVLPRVRSVLARGAGRIAGCTESGRRHRRVVLLSPR